MTVKLASTPPCDRPSLVPMSMKAAGFRMPERPTRISTPSFGRSAKSKPGFVQRGADKEVIADTPAEAAPIEVADFAPLLRREAYKAYLEALDKEEQAATDATKRAEIHQKRVETSVKNRVLCPLTSLLVLETEADYRRFKIDRNSLAEIMQVGANGIELRKRAADEVPEWNTISISGYHMREAGCTAVQEVAFTLANGTTYVQAAIDAGLDVDAFAPRLSFFFNAHNNMLEEVAKFRAARRMWARIMREHFAAKNPRSWMLRFHTQTAGSTLTAQQPENNIVRTTLQALAAVMGGTQSLHTNGFDEALSLPTENAARIALRTQQILAHESGVAQTVDPLAGSYYVESLTNEIEQRAEEYMATIGRFDLGGRYGMLMAIEQGYVQREIQNAAYAYQKAVEEKEAIVVGVNEFVSKQEIEVPIQRIEEDLERRQVERVQALRTRREAGIHAAAPAPGPA